MARPVGGPGPPREDAVNRPTLDQVLALDGRAFATLSESEAAVFAYYRRGNPGNRATVAVVPHVRPLELAATTNKEQANAAIRHTTSRVRVIVQRAD